MKTPRQSGVELLRVLAMAAIVCGHFLRQSAFGAEAAEACPFTAALLGSGLRIAVNVFLLVGCWFMAGAAFRPRRLLNLYGTVAGFSIPITLVAACCGGDASLRAIGQGVLPFFGRSVWYASAYLSLLAVSPWLNRMLTLPSLGRFLVVCGVTVCGAAAMPSASVAEYTADLLWFPLVFLFAGWLRTRTSFATRPANALLLLAGLGLYAALAFARTVPAVSGLAEHHLCMIQSPLNFFCAFAVFAFFVRLRLKPLPPVNAAARGVFAVYVLHQIPAWIPLQWDLILRVFRAPARAPLSVALVSLSVAATLFALYSAVDFLRRRFVAPVLARTRFCERLGARLERFYAGI